MFYYNSKDIVGVQYIGVSLFETLRFAAVESLYKCIISCWDQHKTSIKGVSCYGGMYQAEGLL